MATVREMKTNGCTMRAHRYDPGCARHAAMDREESFTHKRRNSVFARVGSSGAMMRHGSDKPQTKGRDLRKLDNISADVKSTVWPVLIRRGNKLLIAKVTP